MRVIIVSAVIVATPIMVIASEKKETGMKHGHIDHEGITRAYLLSHGFKEVSPKRDVFEAKDVRLSDVSQALGFALSSLRRTPGQSLNSDVRRIEIRGVTFVIRSEVRDKAGDVVANSLDAPDAICTVSVSLKAAIRPRHEKPDRGPAVRILSLSPIEGGLKTAEMKIELAAEGMTPVAFSRSEIAVQISPQGSDESVYVDEVRFQDGTPEVITVLGRRKPLTLTLTIAGRFGKLGKWGELRPGQYDVTVSVNGDTKGGRQFDFQWLGQAQSNPYHVVIK